MVPDFCKPLYITSIGFGQHDIFNFLSVKKKMSISRAVNAPKDFKPAAIASCKLLTKVDIRLTACIRYVPDLNTY